MYLDTSDVAHMHLAIDGPIAHVREFLLEKVNRGCLQIGLSCYVLFELLQKASPDHREDRIKRLHLLKQLCGDNAFPYPADLGTGHALSDDGVWFPRSYLALFDVENIVQNLVEICAHHSRLRRSERRFLSDRKHFVKWVCANPARLRLLISAQATSLPLGHALIENRWLEQYIASEKSRDAVNHGIFLHLTDPVLVYKAWFENLGQKDFFNECRAEFFGKFKVVLDEMSNLFDKIDTTVPSLRAEIKEALRVYGGDREARGKFVGLDRDIRTLRAEISRPTELLKRSTEWIGTVGEKSAAVAAQIVYAFYNEKRRIKESDVVDFLHALYLPHTDLWRGDKAFSDLLIKHKVDFAERVVPSLSELPNRIAAEMAKQEPMAAAN